MEIKPNPNNDRKVQLEKVNSRALGLLASVLKTSFLEAYREEHSMENIEAYCDQHYTLEALEKVIKDPAYDVYLAKKKGQDVAALVIYHRSCPLRPQVKASELKQLYVLSSQYGTGLGKHLMEKSFEIVREGGGEWIWLCVSDRNYRAQRFYLKMNFEKIGKGPVLEVGTEKLPSSIMIRRLKREEFGRSKEG
ncbi:MAG: GNAT family N-acetyltransferase [Bacteroidota bacterium]